MSDVSEQPFASTNTYWKSAYPYVLELKIGFGIVVLLKSSSHNACGVIHACVPPAVLPCTTVPCNCTGSPTHVLSTVDAVTTGRGLTKTVTSS